jgi:hypothetical protein
VYFPGRPGQTLVGLPLLLAGPVSPVDAQGSPSLDITTRVSASAQGVEVDSRTHDFRASFTDPEARRLLERGLRVTEALELPPGVYDLEATLRVNGLGLEAVWRSSAAVPGIDPGGLALSGVSLLADDSAPPLVADIFTAGRAEGEPASPLPPGDPFRLAGGRRAVGAPAARLDPSRPVLLFFRVHGAGVDPASGKPAGLALTYSLVPEAGGLEILPPARMLYFGKAEAAGAFDAVAEIDLRAVEPGSYRAKIAARDGQAAAEAGLERAFEIAAQPGSPDRAP